MTVVLEYLDLLDAQREAAFAALVGVEEKIWKRPSPGEWSIGEILDHNYLLIASTYPYVKFAWNTQRRRSEKRRKRPYVVTIEDPYHKPGFPMWVGFLWRPRYTPKHPTTLEMLKSENRELHKAVRGFYEGKDPDQLGNTFLYDPLFGWINLIVTLRIGIYHDQLHFEDVFKLADAPREKQ